ncbi:GNAT family N-acetyltransferase [Enterococcus faecalis]
MNIQLTPAQKDDLAYIVAVYNQAITTRLATADLTPITVESRLTWFAQHQDYKHPLWLIQRGNEVVGWASLSSFYGRPAYQQTVEVSIYIDPAYQGQKIGSAALQQVIQQAQLRSMTTLLAFVFSHNLPSLTLFEKAGFEAWGKLPGVAYLDDQEACDLTILGKKIRQD